MSFAAMVNQVTLGSWLNTAHLTPEELEAYIKNEEERAEIFRYLQDAGRPVTNNEIAEKLGYPAKGIGKRLRPLIDTGRVRQILGRYTAHEAV